MKDPVIDGQKKLPYFNIRYKCSKSHADELLGDYIMSINYVYNLYLVVIDKFLPITLYVFLSIALHFCGFFICIYLKH